MSGSLNINFYNSAKMGQPNSIEDLLGAAINAGMDVPFIHVVPVTKHVDELKVKASWKDYRPENAVDFQVAYDEKEFTFHFIEKRLIDEFVFIAGHATVQWFQTKYSRAKTPTNSLKLSSSSTAMFTQKEYNARENCLRLIEFAKKLYMAHQPEFGFIENGLLSGYTTQKSVAELKIPHIYWANFFGPAFVEFYGRDFFDNAPGWKVEFLDDGGCLYVLSPDINRNKAGVQQLEQAVKDYFGVEAVRKKRKPKKTRSGRHPDQPEPIKAPELEIFNKKYDEGTLTEAEAARLLATGLLRLQYIDSRKN